jgi:hypothetical protein
MSAHEAESSGWQANRKFRTIPQLNSGVTHHSRIIISSQPILTLITPAFFGILAMTVAAFQFSNWLRARYLPTHSRALHSLLTPRRAHGG